MVRVMIVDDDITYRYLLKIMFETLTAFEVVAEAGTAEEALSELALARPHIILLDVRLPGMDGFEATRQIAGIDPEVRTIVMSSDDNPRYPARARQAGAHTFVPKVAIDATMLRDLAMG